MKKLRTHLVTLPRWFALPFFAGPLLCGVALSHGHFGSLNTWLAFFSGLFGMCGGHSFNTLLDWYSGLDMPGEGSVEKAYTGGCGVISGGLLSTKEVLANALGWYVLSLALGIVLAMRVSLWVLVPVVLGMGVTFWYSKGKFNWTHELALASGPVLAAVIGALSVENGRWGHAVLATLPVVIIFSFAGLALDEYPDAEANLKKGVKSLAYRVWEYKVDLASYLMFWVTLAFVFQIFLVTVGILAPLTGVTFIVYPLILGGCVFLKSGNFKRVAVVIVLFAALYPILMLLGQIYGR